MSEATFLQAVREHPEDDSLRLVFADWLDEQGDPRGELLRLQVSLARLEPHDENYLEWTVGSERWLNEHGDCWLSQLPQAREEKWPRMFWPRLQWHFRRGLPEYLHAEDFATFRQVKEESVAGTALLALRLSRVSRCKALAKSRLLLGIRELRLDNAPFADAGVTDLVRSPHLSRLTTLILDDNRITSAGCRALADSPNLPALLSLEVHRNHHGDEGTRFLTRSPHRASLERLTLSANALGPASGEALAGSDLLANLRELDLSSNSELADAGAVALAHSGRLGKLEKLKLRGCGLTSRGVTELARSAMPALRRLDLALNHLRDEDLRALASAPYLSRLTELHLGFPEAGAEGIRALADANLASLRMLQVALRFDPRSAEAFAALCSCPRLHALVLYAPGDRAVQVLTAFARAPALAPLTYLHLAQAAIGDRGAELLSHSPALSRLRELDLWSNEIKASGAKALGTSPHLKELRKLRLSFNPLGDEGVAGLVSSPNPPPLIWLDLQGTNIGDEGIRTLVKASDRFPGLSHLNLSTNRVSDTGAVLLAQSPLAARLTKLDLRATGISDRGAEALLEAALRNPGLHLLLPAGYGFPITVHPGPGVEMQARLRQALGRRVECHHGVVSW